MKDLRDVLELPDGPARTAGIAEWFQSLYQNEPSVPILVGGAAVELYTRGAYTTGDLDFVGDVPSGVAVQLERAGFRREGRHWLHEKGQIFIELPASSLDRPDRISVIEVAGSRVVTSSPEGLIVDRLASWQFWKVKVDAANALLLWRTREAELDQHLLEDLARKRRVEKALRSLRDFAGRLAGRESSAEELEKWSASLP